MQLTEYSAQSNDLAAPLKCRQLQFQREHHRQCSFQLPLKIKLLAPFMIYLLLWNAENSTFSENISANAVFSYLWKPRFWHHLQHEVHVRDREGTQNVKLLHNGKPASNEIADFSHSVYKAQCAEKQLIEYSAQSNDLAAPLKCRQLHIEREHQHQRSFQLPLKTKFLAPLTTRSTCSL